MKLLKKQNLQYPPYTEIGVFPVELKNAKCVLLLVSSRRLHRERLASISLGRLCHPVIRGAGYSVYIVVQYSFVRPRPPSASAWRPLFLAPLISLFLAHGVNGARPLQCKEGTTRDAD